MPAHPPFRDESFWDFSLRTYRTPGVPEACIALQDGLGVDVNLLLYCCWAGGRAAALDAPAFERALGFSRDWSGRVVQPLRAARRWMKTTGCAAPPVDPKACMALRGQVKSVELAAEKLQQLALETLPLAAPGQGGLSAVAANLDRYFRTVGAAVDADCLGRLVLIVKAAFPAARDEEWRALARELGAA